MGAQSFIHTAYAETAGKAFDELYNDAVTRHGNDSYNGTISTCSMGRCIKTFASPTKTNEQAARKLIEERDNGEKWTAHYIDMGIDHYIIRTVKKNNKDYTAKYKQKFAVVGEFSGKVLKTYDTKPPADKEAIRLALDGKDVVVKKMMIKLSGNDTVASFSVETKRMDKCSLKNTDKRKVVPIHKYIFFGWAAW